MRSKLRERVFRFCPKADERADVPGRPLSGRDLSGVLKRVRAALWTYGEPKTRRRVAEALDDIDHRPAARLMLRHKLWRASKKLFANSIWEP